LVVYTDAVLSLSVAMQSLQPIPGRRDQIAQFCGAIQQSELSACDSLYCLKSPDWVPVLKPLGFGAAERPNHTMILF
jgi:hypothetical protein